MENLTTVSYGVEGRVARIALDRPERGNGITLEMPRELSACVERANLDPEVRVIALSGNGPGFCGGYDLVASAEGQSVGLGIDDAPARLAARPRGPSRQPRPRPGLGPDGRLPDDVAKRARVHEPVSLREAGGLQGARLLRRRRHGHGAVLRPAGGRGRGEDRLSPGARLGRPHHRALGRKDRAGQGQATAAHRRLDLGDRGGRMGPRRRGGAGRRPRPALRAVAASGSPGCRPTSW